MKSDLPRRIADIPIRFRTFLTLVGALAGSFITSITMAFLLGSRTTSEVRAREALEGRVTAVEQRTDGQDKFKERVIDSLARIEERLRIPKKGD